MEVWHGNVMHGITLRACIVLAPLSHTEFNVGQCALFSASGRTPSRLMKTTEDINDSLFICLTGVARRDSGGHRLPQGASAGSAGVRLSVQGYSTTDFFLNHRSINEIRLLLPTFDIHSHSHWLHIYQNTSEHSRNNQNPALTHRSAPCPTWPRASRT